MPRLSSDEARDLLASARVARLATMTPGGAPHLVPVTFAAVGDTIYTAVDGKPKSTLGLRRLDHIRRHPSVAVLADHYEEDWTALWWSRADGLATVLADPRGVPALLAGRYPQYATVAMPGPFIVIQVTRWSGWSAAGSPP